MEEDNEEEDIPEEDPPMKVVNSTLINPYIIGAEINYRSSVRKRKRKQKLRPFSRGQMKKELRVIGSEQFTKYDSHCNGQQEDIDVSERKFGKGSRMTLPLE
jgi:hypothetical protein